MGTTVWIQIPLETFVFRIQKSLGLSFFSRLAYGNRPTQGLSLQKVQGSLYDTNPNNPLSKGKSLKIIVHLQYLHQVWFHLMTPIGFVCGKLRIHFPTVPTGSPLAEGRRVAPSKTLKRSSTACLEWPRCDEVIYDQGLCGWWSVMVWDIKQENVYTYICISKCKHGTYAIKSYINVILNPMKLDGNPRWPHKYFRSKGTRWWE